MKRLLTVCSAVLALVTTPLCSTSALAQTGNGLTGFAGYQDLGLNGVTGGGAGKVVHVSTRADFQNYITGAIPYVIILDADIEGAAKQNYRLYKDVINVGSNKTVIGAGSGKTIDGICLDLNGQQNVIFRNLFIKHGNDDAIAMRNCHHIWVDHCDLGESYDGLLDFTVGSDYMTCSWTKLHDHDKVSITNSGTCHFEDYGKEHVTFAHCWFADNTQRNPRIGYGRMHIYNGYWTNISSYCIGFHSQAQVLSENNYFTSSANHPFNNQYTSLLPYCGYLTDKGSYFANGKPSCNYSQPYTDISYTPLTYYNYDFDLLQTSDVPESIQKGVGPKDGLQYEPILCPANGATEVPLSQKLSWGAIDGNPTMVKVMFGENPDKLIIVDNINDLSLSPSTTYFWQVIATVEGTDHASPVYQFTTAAETAATPYPTDKASDPWLRWPSSRDGFTTAMPLSWRQAADAKAYRCYLSEDEATLDNGFIGETTKLSLQTTGNLTTGKTYYWRVDVVKADGTLVKGRTWSFSTPDKKWIVGKNEVEDLYLSAMAFANNFSGYSNNGLVRGDQGPGSIMGTFNGSPGTYAISVTHKNQTSGPTLFGLFVNNKTIDAWISSTDNNSTATRQTRQTVHLETGDDIRLDFVSGYVEGSLTEAYGVVDFISITPAEGDVVETNRPSGQYHEPVSTGGYDCEYLRISDVFFTDSLGTVGDKDSEQVKDKYCSWITKTDDKLTVYLKQTAMVKRIYRSGTNENVRTDTLDASKKFDYTAPMTEDDAPLFALRLYKILPADTLYFAPTADTDSDNLLLYSPDCIFIDANGIKGDKGKGQIRDEYDQWMKYTNPTANEVQTKNAASGIKAFINPETDEKVSGYTPKGKLGTTDCYCVSSTKYMTYFIQNTQKVKFYISGTAGSSDKVQFTVTPTGEQPTVCYSEIIAGKNVASGVKEIDLDPTKQYQIKLLATSGDMLIYATKFWPAVDDPQSIENVPNSLASALKTQDAAFNLNGQKVAEGYRGIVIKNGKKLLVK